MLFAVGKDPLRPCHPERAFLFAAHHHQTAHGCTSGPETARSRHRRQLTGRSRRQRRRPDRPRRPGQRPAKNAASAAHKPPDAARARHTTRNSKHKQAPLNGEKWAGTRHRPGHPPRFPTPARRPAGKAVGVAGLMLWPASRSACLGLACGLAGGHPARRRRTPWQVGRLMIATKWHAADRATLRGQNRAAHLPQFQIKRRRGRDALPCGFCLPYRVGAGRAFQRGSGFPHGPMRRVRGHSRRGNGPQAMAAGPKHRAVPARPAAAWSGPLGPRNTALLLGPRGAAGPQASF
jgi:hypothetical protein